MKQQTSAATKASIKGKEIIDFSGKTIYVGIDIHQKDWQVAALCEEVVLSNFRMSAGADGVIAHLRKRYSGATFHCVYESCAWGFELQRHLTAAGMDCIVAHAADVSGSDKERKRKTDEVDALKLARHLAAGLLKGIHIPEQRLQKQRSLVRLRHNIVRDLSRCKNRLKGLFKYQGIELPKPFEKNNWSHNFLNWIEDQSKKDSLLEDVISLMLEEVKQLRTLLLKVEKKLRLLMKEVQYSDQAKLVTSAPGIGSVNAAMFVLEVGDVRRFKGFDQLNDFVGLCPDSKSSGETNRHTGITSRRHKQLRRCLIQAAWQSVRRDPAMLETFQRLCNRMPGNKAIIRIARKLLRRIRRVLLTGIPYQMGVVN
jgi:transposase